MNVRSLVFLVLVFVLINFADFSVFVNHRALPGGDLLIRGNASGISDVNVSVSVLEDSSFNSSNVSVFGGAFTINLTAPSTNGEYTLLITTNESTLSSKSIPVTVSDIKNATISVIDSPTFQTGSTFQVNVTLFNETGGVLIGHSPPELVVFQPMSGVDISWTTTNQSNETDSEGSIIFNITIPDSASGANALVVEKGAAVYVVNVKAGSSGVQFSVLPQTSEGADAAAFGVNENVTLKAKLKYGNGSVITGASITSLVLLPDGTTSSVTFSEQGNGIYSTTFTETSQSGSYAVDVKAVSNSLTFRTGTGFIVGALTVDLVPDVDKFFKEAEKGGKIAVKPGAEVQFNVMVKNLTSKEFMSGSTDESEINLGAINCSKITLVDVTRINDSVESSILDFSSSTNRLFGSDVCSINFSAPSTSAIYKVQINVENNDQNFTGVGFVPVQTFMLKVQPTMTVAGEQSFHQMFSPGSNVTFNITGINASGDSLDGSNISNLQVVSLFNLPTGQEVSLDSLQIVTDDNLDTIQITLPTDLTDAFVLSVSATIDQYGSAETTSGDTFFFSKYVVGFIMPKSESNGGEGQNMEMNAYSKCNGSEAFAGQVMLASTGEFASNIWLNSVPQMVMEEETGKLVTHCISFATNSSVNGSLITTATFNDSCTFSGNYFFLGNVTYSDDNGSHNDGIPGFFQCVQLKGEVQFNPEQGGFSIASSAKINVSVSNVKYLNGSNMSSGTVEILELRAFEGYGPPRFIEPEDDLIFDLVDGEANFQLFTSNFSETSSWTKSEGFVEGSVRVCDLSETCNTFITGIPVGSSVEVWIDFMGSSSTFVIGQNVTITLMAKTNLSLSGNNLSVRFEKFGMMGGIPASGVAFAKTSDNWDANDDNGFETWKINATVPVLSKGEARAIVIVTDEVGGEKITRELFGSVQGSVLGIPEAAIPLYQYGTMGNEIDSSYNSSLTSDGWNMSWIVENFGFSYSPNSFSCFMPNISIQTFGGMGGPEFTLVNETTKLLVLDTTGDDRPDTILLRNTELPNNSTNADAFTIVNSTNRTMVNGLYLWELMDCGFIRLINANSSPTTLGNYRFVGEKGVDERFIIPYLVLRGSTPVSGASVNITAIYSERDDGFGIGTQLPASNYSVTPGLTDSNGIAFVYLNISTSGRYKLFWRLNGSVDDVANMASVSEVEIRRLRGYGQLLYGLADGLSVITLTNESGGAGNLMCPDGGCYEVFNGSTSDFVGFGELLVAFNASNNGMVFNLAGSNGTCENPLSENICSINDSTDKQRFSVDQNTFSIAANDSAANTKTFAFYTKYPSLEHGYSPSESEMLALKICAENISLSSENTHEPLSEANISALFMREYSFSGPPTTTILQMYNPLTDVAANTLPIWTDGCTAFKFNKTSGTWPNQGELKANITVDIGGTLVTEQIHLGNINR